MKQVNFVNVRLDVASVVILGADGIHGQDAVDWFMDMPKEGYKCSFSYSIERSSWIATLTGGDDGINAKLALTQWGKDLAACAEKLYLIHEVIDKDHDWRMAEHRLEKIIREAISQITG